MQNAKIISQALGLAALEWVCRQQCSCFVTQVCVLLVTIVIKHTSILSAVLILMCNLISQGTETLVMPLFLPNMVPSCPNKQAADLLNTLLACTLLVHLMMVFRTCLSLGRPQSI